jgi:Uma2 family endonuclease
MSRAASKKYYTPAEYYELEAKAEYKSDYYNGEIFPCGVVGPDGQLISMAGGSVRHSQICSNILREVGNRLKGSPCSAFESNVRMRIRATGLRTYPDVSIYCGDRQHDPEDFTGQTLLNPSVLFEVLSPTTEGYDRGTKAMHYRRVESLQALVLVKQEEARIEVHVREGKDKWTILDIDGMDAVLTLPVAGVELPLAEIYDGVDFNSDR